VRESGGVGGGGPHPGSERAKRLSRTKRGHALTGFRPPAGVTSRPRGLPAVGVARVLTFPKGGPPGPKEGSDPANRASARRGPRGQSPRTGSD
jgi:hypothetical protein